MAIVKCPKCYFDNKPGAKFCGSCGNKMGAGGSPSPPRQTRPTYTPGRSSSKGRTPIKPPAVRPKPSYSPPARSPYTPPGQVNEELFPMDLKPARDEEIFAMDLKPARDEEIFAMDLKPARDEELFPMDLGPARDEELFPMDLGPARDEEDFDTATEDAYKRITEDAYKRETSAAPVYRESSMLNAFLSGRGNIREIFIMKEILSVPKSRQKKKRRTP